MRTTEARRAVVGALCVLVFLLATASAQAAEWRTVTVPGGPMLDLSVANASTWLVEGAFHCCNREFELTEDGGANWTTVPLTGFPDASFAGAAEDGSFRVIARRKLGDEDQELQVFKIDANGAEPLGPVLHGKTILFSDLAAVSPDGVTWVPYWSTEQSAFELARVGADGSVTTTALPEVAGTDAWAAQRTYLGMRLERFAPASGITTARTRPTYRLGDAGEVLPAETYPVSYENSDVMLSSETGQASWDGGAHWAEIDVKSIPTTAPGALPRYFSVGGGIVAESYSPFLFRDTALAWPEGVPSNFVVDTGSGLLAWHESTIYIHEGGLPPLPLAIGALQPDTERMLARADLFRADAGLPPLTGDSTLSQASRNHSTYTALNAKAVVESPHEETPGLPGFTGVEPWDRCEAVGTTCNSEVMYSPGVADPVGGWLATIYHRPLLGSPEAGLVGAAEASGGWAVMDSKGPENILVGPFGYPTGRWRGEDGFSGETPDPIAACRTAGQPISAPLGIAVSLYMPSLESEIRSITVRRRGQSAALPGCLLSDDVGNRKSAGVFILDDPLVAGATYDVEAVWNPGPDELPGLEALPGANLGYSWSFNFASDEPGAGAESTKKKASCQALALRTIKSVARARRTSRHQVLGIEEKVTLKQRSRVHLRRARLDYWKAGHRYSIRLKLGRLAHREVTVGPTSFVRFRLPRPVLARVIPGEAAELHLSFSGRRASGCNRVVKVSRLRKVKLGWVRVKGPVGWVSAAGKHARKPG